MDKGHFFYACQKGHLDTVNEALKEDPSLVGLRDEWGRTPLHYACGNGHAAVVHMLILQGAPRKATDKRGETPLKLAYRYNFTPLMALLGHAPRKERPVNLETPSDTELATVIEGEGEEGSLEDAKA